MLLYSCRVGGPFTSAVKEESTDASGLKPQGSLPGGGAPGGAGGPGKPRDGGRGPRRFPVDLAPEPNILQEVVIHKKVRSAAGPFKSGVGAILLCLLQPADRAVRCVLCICS